MKNVELLKRALKQPELLAVLPQEAFTDWELVFLNEMQRQTGISNIPATLKSVARELVQTRDEKWHKQIGLTAKAIAEASDLDAKETELQLFRCRSLAQVEIAKRLVLLDADKDSKDIAALTARLGQLSEVKLEQWHKPVNATQWDKLQRAEEQEMQIGVDWFSDNEVPFKKGVLYAFIATTNGGKTIIKTWMATMFMQSGYNVLYLAQEEPYTDTIRRIHQSALGLTERQYRERTQASFEQVGEEFNKLHKQRQWGSLEVAEWPNIKIEDLATKVKDKEYDVLIVDYAKLVDVNSKSNAEWERIGKVFAQLKTLAMEHKLAIFTSIQLNRESSRALLQDGRMADITDVAGAYEATNHANYIWSVKLDYTPENDLAQDLQPNTILGQFTLQVQKQKYGRLRKGDQMYFDWTADHMLVQRNIPTLVAGDVPNPFEI